MSRKAGRSERIQVSLAPTAFERLVILADERGLAVSTLAAAVLGEFLAGKDRDALQHRRFAVVET